MSQQPDQIYAALAEDVASRWVPDSLGEIDSILTIQQTLDSETGSGPRDVIRVPKPDGSWMEVQSLGFAEMTALYLAGEGSRDAINETLLPGVCGYRRGAEVELSYSAENQRFHEYSQGLAEGAAFVALADVKQFFRSTSWTTVERRVEAIAGKSAAQSIADYAQGLHSVSGLPAGHADARMFGNAVLDLVDRAVGEPLARWVDDYRVFTKTERSARESLDRLDAALASLGLRLNTAKVSIIRAAEFRRLRGLPLESVYHPTTEDQHTVRTSLRTVFLESIGSTQDRRRLRFALPRLATEMDDFAIDWTLATIATMPWEAPRFCAYLATFANDLRVKTGTQTLLLESLHAHSEWLSIRLAALACSTKIDSQTADVVVRQMRNVRSSGLWALLLRAMSISGHAIQVKEALAWAVVDPRAAVGSLRDLDMDDLNISGRRATVLRECLDESGQAPAPQVHSIL